MRYLLLAILICSAVAYDAYSWQGRWSNSFGPAYACVYNDTNPPTVELFVGESDLYIGTDIGDGYINGTFYAPGLKYQDWDDVNYYYSNWGSFKFGLSSAYKFSGIAKYAEAGSSTWTVTGDLGDSEVPTVKQCFGQQTNPRPTANKTLAGSWLMDNSINGQFDICLTENLTRFESSYRYRKGSSVLIGYVVGECFLNGTLCHGDWYESGEIWGSYLIRLTTDDRFYAVWWEGGPWEYSYSDVGDILQHDYESGTRMISRPTLAECRTNSGFYFDNYAWQLGTDATLTIILVCCCGIPVLGYLLITIFCGCRGGGGSYGHS